MVLICIAKNVKMLNLCIYRVFRDFFFRQSLMPIAPGDSFAILAACRAARSRDSFAIPESYLIATRVFTST